MSSKKRVFQIGERIREVVATELMNAADPRFSLVTITSVVVSPDLKTGKIYWVVSFQNGVDRAERTAEVVEALNSAAGFLKRTLSKELGIRYVPNLKFFYDDTLDTAEEVNRLLAKAKIGMSS